MTAYADGVAASRWRTSSVFMMGSGSKDASEREQLSWAPVSLMELVQLNTCGISGFISAMKMTMQFVSVLRILEMLK